MRFLIKIIITTLSVLTASYVLPGVDVDSFITAIFVSIVLGVLNALLKPLIIILTLPINIITLGLFSLVINAGIILLGSHLVPGFSIDGFISALLFSIVVSLVSSFLDSLVD